MAALAPILLLPLLLKNKNLVGSIGLNDRGFDRGVRQWRASLDLTAILHHQNVAQLNLRSRLAFEFFQSKCLAWCNPVLFAARTYHGVHGYIPFRIDKRLFYGANAPNVNDGFIYPASWWSPVTDGGERWFSRLHLGGIVDSVRVCTRCIPWIWDRNL
jgi:hypothetical protein